jgi:hypothetical protein
MTTSHKYGNNSERGEKNVSHGRVLERRRGLGRTSQMCLIY